MTLTQSNKHDKQSMHNRNAGKSHARDRHTQQNTDNTDRGIWKTTCGKSQFQQTCNGATCAGNNVSTGHCTEATHGKQHTMNRHEHNTMPTHVLNDITTHTSKQQANPCARTTPNHDMFTNTHAPPPIQRVS